MTVALSSRVPELSVASRTTALFDRGEVAGAKLMLPLLGLVVGRFPG